jgi:hypothetical protein
VKLTKPVGLSLLLVLLVTAVATGSSPAFDAIIATPATIRDFMIQDVCLDASGRVLIGVSPVDGNPACVAERDLRPGERLPYHKDDQPSPADRVAAPEGYQRHDSFPVETAGLGAVVEDSFDFGAGGGRRFGVFDAASDGGDIVVMSADAVSIGATRDADGFKLWVGKCDGRVTLAALAHAWLIATFDPQHPAPLAGSETARLNGVKAMRRPVCPARFNAAFTRWRVAPFRFRDAPGQGTPITLTTLISNHYGGADPVTADHVERFYFTRELGGTRWERWQNAAGDAHFSAAWIARRAAWFASTGRCSPSPMPEGGARMLLIDCREWTRIIRPIGPAGDAPGFFLAEMRARGAAPPFLAAPVAASRRN